MCKLAPSHSDDVACRDETLVNSSKNYALNYRYVMALFHVICWALVFILRLNLQ